MPFQFSCPYCQTKTLVDDQYSGHIGRCVTCDKPIEIPNFVPRHSSSLSPSAGPLGKFSPTARRLVAAVLCIVGIVGLGGIAYRYGLPAITQLSTGRERAIAVSNLEKIASALNAYAADHGTYPSPMVRDSNGNPMHSWRVAVLPYLNESSIYNEYDFNQPWDSPTNYALAEKMPDVYSSTNPGSWQASECHFQLISGDRTLFPSAGPLNPQKLVDDPSKTALVVEAISPKVRQNQTSIWTEPTELDLQAMTGLIGSNPGVEIGSVTEGGAAIATVDGTGHFIEDTTPPEIVLAILTANGGEPLADDALD